MTEYDKIKFRDECAIAAMQSFVIKMFAVMESTNIAMQIAHTSFDMADAMLEEKLKRDEGK